MKFWAALASIFIKQLKLQKNNGAPGRIRTRDPLITNQVLYQLSYKGIRAAQHSGEPMWRQAKPWPLLHLPTEKLIEGDGGGVRDVEAFHFPCCR